jgi:8-oxo-dGTP diphosphatase
MKTKSVVCCILLKTVRKRLHLLAVERRPDQSYPMKWSIPGGKVERGEYLHRAASREMREELGIAVRFAQQSLVNRTFIDEERGYTYELHYMMAEDWEGEPKNLDGTQMRWLRRNELEGLDWLPDDLIVARTLLA